MNSKDLSQILVWLSVTALAMAVIFFFTGCATTYPASACAEYGGIRRVGPDHIFCNVQNIVYDRKERYHFRRSEDLGLPEVEEQQP